MGKILAVMCCLLLVGCNDSKPQQAVTISQDYQDAIHAQNDAAFEYARLERLAQRERLLSQH